MKTMKKIALGSALFLGGVSAVSPVYAQPFNPFSEQGSEFTAAMMAMLWLGASQSIVEQCDGDVAPYANMLVEFADVAGKKHGEGYGRALAGMFGEGMTMTSNMGCNVDKLRIYVDWANMYYQPVLDMMQR